RLPPHSTLLPYTTLFRSKDKISQDLSGFVEEWIICRINFFRFDVDNLLTVFIKGGVAILDLGIGLIWLQPLRFAAAIFHIQNPLDRKSTRLNSSHVKISY